MPLCDLSLYLVGNTRAEWVWRVVFQMGIGRGHTWASLACELSASDIQTSTHPHYTNTYTHSHLFVQYGNELRPVCRGLRRVLGGRRGSWWLSDEAADSAKSLQHTTLALNSFRPEVGWARSYHYRLVTSSRVMLRSRYIMVPKRYSTTLPLWISAVFSFYLFSIIDIGFTIIYIFFLYPLHILYYPFFFLFLLSDF